MAEIVAAMAMSHAPLMHAPSEDPPADQLARINGAFATLREQLDASRPDLILMLVDDHFENFFRENMPTFAVGLADNNFGPLDHYVDWLGIPQREMPNQPEFARALHEHCVLNGFDLSAVQRVGYGHAVMVPMQFLRPEYDLPLVPLLTNVFTPPVAPLRRAYALGRELRSFLDARPAGERVAVIASGAMSHRPPYWLPDNEMDPFLERMKRFQTEGLGVLKEYPRLMAELGDREIEMHERGEPTVDPVWDRSVLDAFGRGDVEAIAGQSWQQVRETGGHGGYEILNWVILMGIMGGVPGDVLVYEAVDEWITGIGALTYAKALAAA